MVAWLPGPLPAPTGFTGGYTWAQWAPYLQQSEGGTLTGVNPKSTASGLYQITNPTWADFGGLQYAPTAGQATAEQQYAVGQAIFDARGAQPWSTAPAAYSNLTSQNPLGFSVSPDQSLATDYANLNQDFSSAGAPTAANYGGGDIPGGGSSFASLPGMGTPVSVSGGSTPVNVTSTNTVASAGPPPAASSSFFTAAWDMISGLFSEGIGVIIGIVLIAAAIFLLAGHSFKEAHA